MPEPSPFLVTRVMAEVRRTERASAGQLVLGRAFRAAGAAVLVAAGIFLGTVLGGDIAGLVNGENGTEVWETADAEPSVLDYCESVLSEE